MHLVRSWHSPVAIGAIKRCFTNGTGEQHPPNAGPSAIIPLGLSKNPASPAVLRIEDDVGVVDVRYRGRHAAPESSF
jgi:hypothetical protein